MPRHSERGRSDGTATVLGPDPADPATEITLPERAFGRGCYLEGSGSDLQEAVLHSWCVQWAEAGYGFCYVHPGGSAPLDLLASLPEGRLDDVVWIDVDRAPLAERLDVPPERRVSIDVFDAPDPDPETFALDPVNVRVNAYLDAFSEHPSFDWNAARVLSSVLPAVFLRDDVSHTDVGRALELNRLEELARRFDGRDDDTHQALAAAIRATSGVLDRVGSPAREAASLLDQLEDTRPDALLTGTGSYDVGRAILENDLVFVTGDALETDGRRWHDDMARVRTNVLVAALCCRLQEVAAFAPPASSMFPVVLDGFGDLLAGEGDLFERLLATSDDLPLAPVYSGPPPSELDDPMRLAVGDHADTRVVVPDADDREPHPDVDPDRDPARTVALGIGADGAVERYLHRSDVSVLPDAPLYWCRINATDRTAGIGALQESVQPVVVPERPDRRRSSEEVAAVLTRSLERHGQGPNDD